MKDIKVKEHNRSPKVLTKASRMPKQLVKKTILEAKEKSLEGSRISEDSSVKQTPSGYAGDKVGSVSKQMAVNAGKESVRISYDAGRKAAKKTYEKLQNQKKKETTSERTKMNSDGHEEATDSMDRPRTERSDTAYKKENARKRKKKQDVQSSKKSSSVVKQKRQEQIPAIRTRETVRRTVRTKGSQGAAVFKEEALPYARKFSIKKSPRLIKSSTIPRNGLRKVPAAAAKEVRAAHMAKQVAVTSMQRTAMQIQRSATAAVRFKRMVEAAARTIRSAFAALAAGGGAMFVVLILIVGVVGGVFSYSSSQSSASLSSEVLSYTATIQRYASEYGIPEYVSVIQAIMMQESGGQGTDPMQCSECPYNTLYPNSPGAIQDPEYSIQVGIRYYADCVQEAGCTGPEDLERLKLSLQGYNYGNGYISWALQNYGGYSEANALLFSQQQAASHGWSSYGDPEYVSHVLRYYSGGNPFAALFGNDQMVSVALSQLGNEGGQKFWSWYGFDSKVDWCACFVSWCADQCGLIESGAVPKFSSCSTGMAWFQNQGKWQGAGSTPTAGMIIFIDWNQDGICDHVGIVEKSENGRVYTVEGNSSDAVNQRDYDINYACIFGYGVVAL